MFNQHPTTFDATEEISTTFLGLDECLNNPAANALYESPIGYAEDMLSVEALLLAQFGVTPDELESLING